MLKKVRFIIAFISLSVCLCFMSSTYSRYIADTTGNIDTVLAKWQILVNNTDVTGSTSSTISFTPVIEANDNVAPNVVAPSSKGYYDIIIDPTNVDVSFKYTITLGVESENVPDLKMTKYAILPVDYVEGNPLETTDLTTSVITNTLVYDKETPSFEFNPFTIRVYFEWIEGTGESMDDDADTAVGNLAATEGVTFRMNANVAFEQVFE